MTPKTHYATLGVTTDATPEGVTAAFRSLAQQAHPDKGGDVDAWVTLVRAYTCLRNAVSARAYLSGLRIQTQACARCDGSGVQARVSGPRAKAIVTTCSVCEGTGTKP